MSWRAINLPPGYLAAQARWRRANFDRVSARRGCVSIVYIYTHWRQIRVQSYWTELSLRRFLFFSIPHPNPLRHYLWLLRFSPLVVGCTHSRPLVVKVNLFHLTIIFWFDFTEYFLSVISPISDRIFHIHSDLPRSILRFRSHSTLRNIPWSHPFPIEYSIFIWISILRNIPWSHTFLIEY